MKVYNYSVELNKVKQFDEIIKATGARYLSTPRYLKYEFRADFEPGETTLEKLTQMETDILEVRKDQWWRKLLRRIGAKV
jgi:hypothetical protein